MEDSSWVAAVWHPWHGQCEVFHISDEQSDEQPDGRQAGTGKCTGDCRLIAGPLNDTQDSALPEIQDLQELSGTPVIGPAVALTKRGFPALA